jgi:hypothetical protein
MPKFIATGTPGKDNNPNALPGTGGAYNDPRMECITDCKDVPHPMIQQNAVGAVLAGVGAAGIGTSVVLLLISSPTIKRARVTPAFAVDLTLKKVSTSALWRF